MMDLLTHGGEHHEIGDGGTDSRSALPMKNRRQRRLRIVKCDEAFSVIFLPECEYMELELASEGHQGAHEVGAHPRGAGAPPTLMDRWWAPWPSSFVGIFHIF